MRHAPSSDPVLDAQVRSTARRAGPPLSSAGIRFAMRKTLGYFFVILSFLPWAAIAALPFFDISIGMAAGITTGLLVGGEVSFFLGLALLGREAWGEIKAAFRNKHG